MLNEDRNARRFACGHFMIACLMITSFLRSRIDLIFLFFAVSVGEHFGGVTGTIVYIQLHVAEAILTFVCSTLIYTGRCNAGLNPSVRYDSSNDLSTCVRARNVIVMDARYRS